MNNKPSLTTFFEKPVTLTISPAPRKQYIDRNYPDRKLHFVNYWEHQFQRFLHPAGTYNLYLEISKGGLLHWHGTVHVKDPELFCHAIAYFKYEVGVQLEVDSISDPTCWDQYITKDHSLMKVITDNKKKKQRSIKDIL